MLWTKAGTTLIGDITVSLHHHKKNNGNDTNTHIVANDHKNIATSTFSFAKIIWQT